MPDVCITIQFSLPSLTGRVSAGELSPTWEYFACTRFIETRTMQFIK